MLISVATSGTTAWNGALALPAPPAAPAAAAAPAVESATALAAAISHDLRAPLSTLRGSVDLLRDICAEMTEVDPQLLLPNLERIDRAATRMACLIDQLLDAARLENGQPLDLVIRPTDLSALTRRAVDDLEQSGTRHRIVVKTPASPVIVECDASRIERMLGNVLDNAIKYSPAGSEIQVTVREARIARDRSSNGQVSGHGARRAHSALITVDDRGIGIPSTDLPRIFERYHRAGNAARLIPGTGLGLYSARQVVEQHGGAIKVVSREGDGTRVSVRLPLRRSFTL